MGAGGIIKLTACPFYMISQSQSISSFVGCLSSVVCHCFLCDNCKNTHTHSDLFMYVLVVYLEPCTLEAVCCKPQTPTCIEYNI